MTVIKTHTHNTQPPIKNKSRLKKNAILAIAACLAMSSLGPSFAAEDDNNNPEYDFDQVVITATKTEKKVSDVPAAVEVITSEDMEKHNVKRVGDALTTTMGLYVRQAKGLMGTTDTIVMRGFSSQKQVLILIDGQPVNDGYNSGVDFANIPTEIIERIEVIKGPASALYGSAAMGGVINIITKSKAKQETTVKLGIGGQNTSIGSILTSGSVGKLDYYLSAQGTTTDGYNILTTGGALSPNGNNGMNRELYNAKFVYHPNDNTEIGVLAGKYRFRYFYEKNDRNYGYTNTESWGLNYKQAFGNDSSLKINYSTKDIDSYYATSATMYGYTPSTTDSSEIMYETKISPKDRLIIGYAYNTEDMAGRSNNQNVGGSTNTHSIFFQDEHQMSENTIFYLGGRYDKWSINNGYSTDKLGNPINLSDRSEASFNPKVGIVHKFNEKMTLRSSIGKAFRNPTIYELARTWEGSTGTIFRNEPNLKSEKALSYEIGVDYEVNKTLSAKLNVYHTDITDGIYSYRFRENNRDISQITNASKMKVNGFEIGLNKRLSSAWNSFFNYTYNDAKVTESLDKSTINKQIANVPKNLFNLGVEYSQNAWRASLYGSYVGDANNPDMQGKSGYGSYEPYFVVNTKISYKTSDNTTISLSVDNLLDRKYFTYYLAPRRTAYVEMSHKF